MRQVLPRWVTPIHYQVELTPNLKDFKFNGSVSVDLAVHQSTRQVLLNANDLIVHQAWIEVTDQTGLKTYSAQVSYRDETLILDFEENLPLEGKTVLKCQFQGHHNDKMAGFYRSSYVDQGEKRFMLITQCQPTDCRRIFPCWDEPNKKATFDVTLCIDPSLVALANGDVLQETLNQVNGQSLKVVKFQRTPLMSTYLFALAVGELEYVEEMAYPTIGQPIRCRTWTRKGQQHLGTFSLDICVEILEFFAEFFGIAYPLSKVILLT